MPAKTSKEGAMMNGLVSALRAFRQSRQAASTGSLRMEDLRQRIHAARHGWVPLWPAPPKRKGSGEAELDP
jgi:hypothetical protein